MAAKKKIVADIEALAKALGEDVKTEDLNDDQLNALLTSLQDKKKKAEEAKAAENDKPDDAVVEENVPEHVVGKGKAITTKRGILADGDAIELSDLAGGEKSFSAFIESGHIVKNKQ